MTFGSRFARDQQRATAQPRPPAYDSVLSDEPAPPPEPLPEYAPEPVRFCMFHPERRAVAIMYGRRLGLPRGLIKFICEECAHEVRCAARGRR